MKKINKLVLPLATVALGTTVVAPLVTACAGQTTEEEVVVPEVELSDVNHGYIPEIEKHEASSSMSKTDAKAAYLAALKENPSIATEDYKNFIGQLPEYFSALQADNEETYQSETYGSGTFDLSINSLQAGLSNFELNNNGLVSYNTGVKADLSYDTVKDGHTFEFDIDLDFTSAFKNFTLDVKRGSTEYVDNLTVITPVWPTNLKQKDWSFTLGLKGSVVAYMDGIQILKLNDIDFKKKFDYRDTILLSYVNLTDLFKKGDSTNVEVEEAQEDPHYLAKYAGEEEEVFEKVKANEEYHDDGILESTGTDKYLMDYLTDLGTFTSYYMSDVTVNPTFKLVGTPEFEPCDDRDYIEAGWFDSFEMHEEVYRRYQFYKGTLVFELADEYDNIDTLNAQYNFVPLNYNGVSGDTQSFPCIIKPYTADPRTITAADPQKFTFEPYTDESGQVVKNKVKLDIWFNPVYNSRTTVERNNPDAYLKKLNVKDKLEELQVLGDDVIDISHVVINPDDYQVTKYAENKPTLDFEIREQYSSSSSYASVEEYSESYVINETMEHYTASSEGTYQNFYVSQELYDCYQDWELNERNYHEQFSSSFGRYEDVTFNLQFEIGDTTAETIKDGSKFLIGNWAIYDIVNNTDFASAATLADPSTSALAAPMPVIVDVKPVVEVLEKYNVGLTPAEGDLWVDMTKTMLHNNVWTQAEALELQNKYIEWIATVGKAHEDNGPSTQVRILNAYAWRQYLTTTYANWDHDITTPAGPFTELKNWHKSLTNNDMKTQFSIESITVNGKPFTNYTIGNNVVTFGEEIKDSTLNIVVKYLGPKNTEFYYNQAESAVRAWTEYNYYLNYFYMLDSITDPTSTQVSYYNSFALPTDVYFYTIPFITCDVAA